jgi:hypothetical protein
VSATPGQAPDSFDSPDGRTYSGPVTAATPGQALSPDPADFAYHVRATAFNVLTGKMAGDEWSVPRSERDAIARAVVDAVEPLIRADERAVAAQEPHAAPGKPHRRPFAARDCECPPGCECWQAAVTPQPAPELAAAMAESRRYRAALEDVRAIILEGANSTEGSRLRRSRAVIRAALEGK